MPRSSRPVLDDGVLDVRMITADEPLPGCDCCGPC